MANVVLLLMTLIASPAMADNRDHKPFSDTIIQNAGASITSHQPSCDPGWELVLRVDLKPACAWAVKEAK